MASPEALIAAGGRFHVAAMQIQIFVIPDDTSKCSASTYVSWLMSLRGNQSTWRSQAFRPQDLTSAVAGAMLVKEVDMTTTDVRRYYSGAGVPRGGIVPVSLVSQECNFPWK
jgi:hypothetical protein